MKLLLTLLTATLLHIIPEPASTEVGEGVFRLDGSTAFCVDSPQAEEVAGFTAEKLRKATGLPLPVRARKGDIVLKLDPGCGIPAEGYSLSVTPKKVTAKASDAAGLFYAMQTLLQLLPAEVESAAPDYIRWEIPCVRIEDAPRFSWRGFHVDPCRHFLSVDEIKKQIDVMAEYKLNVMHWHLTDDQGWRIEIKKYPRLTEVGAWRTEFDGSVHGGFYTQDEIRDVVAYAAERFVTVVPEIEMPGHAISAIRAYPELSCNKEVVRTFYTWGTPDISLCVGSERVFEFLDDVIGEVAALFPSEYIHIGGDECRKNRWEKCPACQARIKAEGIVADSEFTAEEKLQSYAVHRMESILAGYGRKLIGWDEILEGGLSPNATVMSWRGESGGKKAAMAGHEVVMTPSHEGMYLDHFQGDPKIEPVSIGNYTTLEKVYAYDPVPRELVENGKASLVKGVQCNNWSEYIYSVAQREYMLFPRAFALAEIAWTPLDKKDFASFCRRVDDACRRLDFRGINYHIPLPEQPGGSCDNIAFTDKVSLSFTTTRPMEMVYTLDGGDPTTASARYTSPLTFSEDATLKIASLTSYGKLSRVRTINIRKQTPLPPREGVPGGLRVCRTDGKFRTAADLKGAEWYEVPVTKLRDITTLEPFDRNVPDSTRFFAARAEGFFEAGETAVYRFSSDCDQVWIDGDLLIDNGAEVKRYSRHDAELALEKGLHEVKVIYIFNVTGGWYSLRNKTDVSIRKAGDDKWKSIKIKTL